MFKNEKIAYILGSGSIACRHSRILNKFGFDIICVSNRIKSLNEIYHNNSFCNLISYKALSVGVNSIFIIANNTSDHTKTYQNLISIGVDANQIFCEKPGPIGGIHCQILYNLEFLSLKLPLLGVPTKLVHCADARSWPADRHWSERYIFRKRLGGGCINTHSHELNHAYKKSNIDKIEMLQETKHHDIDGNKIISAAQMRIGQTEIILDLLSSKPVRYWEYDDVTLHFYGPRNNIVHKNRIYEISHDEIENSYVKMWEDILFRGSDLTQLNWFQKYNA